MRHGSWVISVCLHCLLLVSLSDRSSLFPYYSYRGIASNMTAVAAPLAMTIFLTDILLANQDSKKH